ncbi:MAG TPA: hypothetical protein VKD28_18780 [Gemmatimonadales bacterium]|nr:hypothetical protein [Gemmatimonadales bacterium]
MSNALLDANGEKVVHFAADVRTLGKIGELADKIIEIAESGAWRHYRTAIGSDDWLECEFDYFLIACDVEYEDVYRAIKWDKLGEKTRTMMDHGALADKRRTLEQAATGYAAVGPETLVERAARLGWTKHNGQPRSPLSGRQQAKQAAGGKTVEQQARERRAVRLSAKRCRDLDRLAEQTLAGLGSDDERRYLLDAITAQLSRKKGRPESDHAQWANDIAEVGGDTRQLAQRWGLSRRRTQERAREIREYSAQPVA